MNEQGQPRRGRLIVLCGLPGSGKTTLAVELEARGAVRITPDEWVLQLGLDDASDDLRHRINLLALGVGERAAAAGATVILDLGFWQREHRDATRTRAREFGVAVELRYLDVPIDEILRRVRKRNAHMCAPWQRIEEADLRTWATWLEPPTPEELALYDAPW
jgi:predicted kinase